MFCHTAKNTWTSPVRPCVPMIIKSTPCSPAVSTIVCVGVPWTRRLSPWSPAAAPAQTRLQNLVRLGLLRFQIGGRHSGAHLPHGQGFRWSTWSSVSRAWSCCAKAMAYSSARSAVALKSMGTSTCWTVIVVSFRSLRRKGIGAERRNYFYAGWGDKDQPRRRQRLPGGEDWASLLVEFASS